MTGGGGGGSAAGGAVGGSSAGGAGELDGGGTLSINQRVENLIAQSYMSTRSRGEGGWPPPMDSVRRLMGRRGVHSSSDNLIATINDPLREASNPNTTVQVFLNMSNRVSNTRDD